MAYTDNCKGCSRSVRVASEEISNMVKEIVDSGNFNLVTEEVYEERLQQCNDCKYLQYETTCIQCGCIVQIRALLADKDCPHTKRSKW
jgi:hypothetical protein